jgi:hypothetical protein
MAQQPVSVILSSGGIIERVKVKRALFGHDAGPVFITDSRGHLLQKFPVKLAAGKQYNPLFFQCAGIRPGYFF